MAAPGKTVAAVNVRVLPNTDAFGRSLKKYLDKLEQRQVLKMKVDLDVKSANADLKKLVDQIGKVVAEVPVKIVPPTGGGGQAQGQRYGQEMALGIQRAVQTTVVQVDAQLNTAQLQARLRTIEADRTVATVEIQENIDKVRNKIADLRSSLTGSMNDMIIDADISRAEAKLEQLMAHGDEMLIKADVDTDVIRRKLAGVGRTAGNDSGRDFGSAFGSAASAGMAALGGFAGVLTDILGISSRIGSQGAQAFGQLGGSAASAAGPIGAAAAAALLLGVLGPILAVAIPGFIGLAGAAIQAAGAIALLPGALAAVAAIGGTIAIGAMGVTDALGAMGKAHQSAGGAAGGNAGAQKAAAAAIASAQKSLSRAVEDAAKSREDAARRVIAAETSLSRAVTATARANADADKRVQRATEDLTRARREAQRAVADLNREVRRGGLNQRRSALEVTQAYEDMNRVLSDPGATATQKELAKLSYEEAVASLDEVIARNQELGEEQAHAAATGIDGIESVMSAQQALADAVESQTETRVSGEERVHDAVLAVQDAYRAQEQAAVQASRSIADAQDAIRQAQDSASQSMSSGAKAANAYADALAALSPSARAFVQQIESMRDRFNQLKNAVQERLFDGLAQQIKDLGEVYFPILEDGLVGIAGELNTTANRFGDLLREARNVAKVDRILQNTQGIAASLGNMFNTLVDPLLTLADIGTRVLGDFSRQLEPLVQQFADWIENMARTGELEGIMRKALDVIMAVLGGVAKLGLAFAGIILAMTDGIGESGFFDHVGKFIDKFLAFVESPEGIAFFEILGVILGFVGRAFVDATMLLIDLTSAFFQAVEATKDFLKGAAEIILAVGRVALAIITFGISELIIAAFTVDWGRLVHGFQVGVRNIMDRLADGVNRGLDFVKFMFVTFPQQILQTVGQWGYDLFEAGKRIIQSIIDGIKAKFRDLSRAMAEVGTTIFSFLPHSPAKQGPLSGRGYPLYSGRAIVDSLAQGIMQSAPAALAAISGVVTDIAAAMDLIPLVPSGALDADVSAAAEVSVTSQAEEFVEALEGMRLELAVGDTTRMINEQNSSNKRR